MCFSHASIAMTKATRGKALFHLTPRSLPRSKVTAGTQAGTWRLELKQMPWGKAAYWLAPDGFLNLLSYISQSHLPRG